MPNQDHQRRFTLFTFSLLVLTGLVIQQAEAGIGGLLGLGNKGLGSKKTSEMLVAASILASLITKHKESQNQSKQRAPMMPMPMPPYGGYAAASSPYGSYGAVGYGGGLGSSLYGGYPGLASAYGGFASPVGGAAYGGGAYGGAYGGY
ncbi:spidroin-1 [Parasteatoda tepidariorum]|uniref:spidroin-1 n=1 Tax=Parasteatoda tepidariorum TaxID=114398 RepID=UPI00077F9440|nr:heterogeneous nuclear ribonucleoprotein A/B [Parasteatoda tepidariorum]XP_015909878.1 heterogeneous nuclear ribonucleoprotein A/B [Parasteatoda tepidariorum]XP_015909879.1 heterogeneous nuclear ribonucleoprotein A/B [Parasteatoda tepidariorum]